MSALAYNASKALIELEQFLPTFAALLPLVPHAKRPSSKDWTGALPDDRSNPDFRLCFVGEVGIGLLCGKASGGICMVDIDCDALVEPAEDVVRALHDAPRIHGARGAKWLVRTAETTSGFALRDSAGKRIGEFLGERQQGVVAGLHPDGINVYQWHRRGEIPIVNVQHIAECLSTLYCPP